MSHTVQTVNAATSPAGGLYVTIDHENGDDRFWEAISCDVTVAAYADKLRALAAHYYRVLYVNPVDDFELIEALQALPGSASELVWMTAQEAQGFELV